MTMNQFLILMATQILTSAIPTGIAIYLGIRIALTHGDFSWRRKNENRVGNSSIQS